MRYEVTVVRDGRELATAGASFRCMSPEAERRLRGCRPVTVTRSVPPAVDHGAVGHSSARHVVLAPPAPGAADRWELRVDTAHPTYFDHPVDHVPGMVLLEAARQAAHLTTGWPTALLTGLGSRFVRYAELDSPCWIEAEAGTRPGAGRALVRVRGSQADRTVFTAELVMTQQAV
jgi:hypothetical protein